MQQHKQKPTNTNIEHTQIYPMHKAGRRALNADTGAGFQKVNKNMDVRGGFMPKSDNILQRAVSRWVFKLSWQSST